MTPLADRHDFGDREHLALRMVECTAPARESESDTHFADKDEEPNPRHALLRALHPNGYRDMRAFRKGEPPKTFSLAAADLAGVDEFADQNYDRDVFVGVAPRINDQGRDTSACHNLHALFADQDYKDSSETEARARLAAFPLAPSAVIASGGGLQSYWLLTEPLDLQNGGAARAKDLLRALATALGADLNAAEPARILRVPGTRNYKYSPPRLVVVEALSERRRYAPSEMRNALQAIDTPSTTPRPSPPRPSSPPLPSSIPFGQQHLTLFREGCRLRRMGWEITEIADALWSLHLHRSEGDNVKHERNDIDRLAHDICKRYEPTADTFSLSEAGDAEFFAACYAANVRFDHRQGRWLILDDHSGIWLPDRTGRLTGFALDVVRMRQRLALKISDSDKRQKALAWTSKSESRARLTNLQTLAQDLAPISDAGDDWDKVPHLLGTPDGVVDLRMRELRRALPDERITMRTSARYDSQAESALWTRVLKEVFLDSRERTWLQTALGYTITGSMKLDKWFLPNGEKGRNGKGTVFGAVANALGDYAMEIDAGTFDTRQQTPYNLAQLPGKRFVHCSEAGNTTTLHHERLKQVTGGDKVRAADKYQRGFEFPPCCKLWFTCNDRPTVTDESAAFWARVIVVLFQQTFLGREDTSIRDELRQDLAHQRAVLRWLVDGASRFYQQDGLGVLPPAFAQATQEFQRENERLADFIAECCVVEKDAMTQATSLLAEYQRFAMGQNVRRPLGSKAFFQAMAKHFERKQKDAVRCYVGVKLKAAPVSDDLMM